MNEELEWILGNADEEDSKKDGFGDFYDWQKWKIEHIISVAIQANREKIIKVLEEKLKYKVYEPGASSNHMPGERDRYGQLSAEQKYYNVVLDEILFSIRNL